MAISFDPEIDQSIASVFWTDGSTLHFLDSPSLLHVLEFEKQKLGAGRTGVGRIQYLLAPHTK